MLSTDALLIVYYLGLGFVALLGWAAIAQDLNNPLDERRRESWNRTSAILAVVGLAHPALPFIARDIARQAARNDDEFERPTSPLVTLATACAAVSIAVAAAVIAVMTSSA